MQKLNFYTKLNCSLCLKAQEIVMAVAYDIPLEIDYIDITLSGRDDLQAAYGQRIPVLARPDKDKELAWPFTATEVRAYLK